MAAALAAADDAWLCGVLHDLNNELMVLKWRIEMLRRQVYRGDGIDREWVRESLGPLDATTRKLIRLAGELRGRPTPQAAVVRDGGQRACDLVALVRRAVLAKQQVAPRHVVSLHTAEVAIIGHWDAGRLERIVDNLLGNAVKYSPDGGPVTVRLTRERERCAEWAELTVQDAGIGIAAADLPHIFEPRYRGNNVIDHQRGSGLGLAIVRQLVAAYGGTIAVESQVGHGTTFTLRLPLTVRIDEQREDGDTPLPAPGLTKVTAGCAAMA